MKECTRCGNTKELSEYPVDSRNSKHQTICRDCRLIQIRAWQSQNKEYIKEKASNPYPFTRIFIRPCSVTGDLFVTPIATAKVSHKAKKAWIKQRQVAQSNINKPRLIDKLTHIQKGLCNLCQSKLTQDRRPNIDHIIPVIKGGDDSDDNLQLICFKCNMIKGTRTDSQQIKKLIDTRRVGII